MAYKKYKMIMREAVNTVKKFTDDFEERSRHNARILIGAVGATCGFAV